MVFIDPQNYHGCPAGTDHDREMPEIDLLSRLTIRGAEGTQRTVQSSIHSVNQLARP